MPRCCASRPLITTQAAAPSESGQALPAVTVPPSRTGFSVVSPESVVEARAHSSLPSVAKTVSILPVVASVTSIPTSIGVISASKRPAACAAAVRCWLDSANSSCISREMP
jgi:hypothetical protein